MKKNNSKSENPLNINQSTYELIPKIKELSKNIGFNPFFSFDLKKSLIDCIFIFMFLL